MVKAVLIVIILFAFVNVKSESREASRVFKNFNISFKTGSSMVITEYKRDLSSFENEFHYLPKYAFSVSFSKVFLKNFEYGYEYELSTFRGYQNNPDFSAYRFGHYAISQMRIEPVIYKSQVQNQNLFLTYHLSFNKEKRVIPYVYFKGGFTRLSSQLRYRFNNELIFAKIGRDPNEPRTSIYIGKFNYGFGLGNEIIIDSKLSLNIQADINVANTDNLDGVYNFHAPPPSGYNNLDNGIYGRIMVGITYTFNPDRDRIASRTFRLKDSFNKKAQKRQIFPWFKN